MWKFGVRSAMPMKKAVELCPEAVVLRGNMQRYKEMSARVLEILERYTPDIEAVSIDEAYLAVQKDTGMEIAKAIRAAIKEELGLPVSIGISVNKLLAKIACDLAKPDNLQALWPQVRFYSSNNSCNSNWPVGRYITHLILILQGPLDILQDTKDEEASLKSQRSLLSLISWNMNQQASNWQTVLDSDVDAALLQEAKPPPTLLAEHVVVDHEEFWGSSGQSWCAAVAGLSKRIKLIPIKTQPLGAGDPDALMVSRPGTIAAAKVRILETGEEIIVISLYAPWGNPVKLGTKSQGWLYADASAHRLISDLSALISNQTKHKIIAAGDLNILYGYGEGGSLYWKGRYDTIFDRMSALGLRFIGPQAPGGGEQASPWPPELPEGRIHCP